MSNGQVINIGSVQAFDTLLTRAKALPVFIDFSAEWCGPCKVISPVFEKLAKAHPKAVFLKVDVDDQRELAQRYNITAMPTFIFLVNGDKVGSIRGADVKGLTEAIEKHAGIKGLTGIIADHAPKAISHTEIKTLFGRKVAIDASMSMYQFLIAVRQQDGQQLQTESGETTSHLMGFFYRTIRMVENGIKPIYVFDGKPPQLKSGVLAKRYEKRDEAKEEAEEAKEVGTTEDVDRQARRQVRVTKEHKEECERLLKAMGIPFHHAPSEAEAQCAEFCRGGLVYGTGSEDMDTLTFNSPIILRHLTFSEARKLPIDVIKLDEALAGLELTMDQFIDFCILCGCDYLEPLKGVGAKTAYKLIKDNGDLAGAIEAIREKDAKAAKKKDKDDDKPVKKVQTIPDEWPWQEARELFKHPDVTPSSEVDFKWEAPDVDALVQFLVNEKGFNEDRVRKGADKLRVALSQKQQGRLDGFFKPMPKAEGSSSPAKKRKAEDTKKDAKKAKTKEKSKPRAAK
ncbi:Elongation of fatty acids protein 2 [Cystobasidiomycetes sp. EMM_F5]